MLLDTCALLWLTHDQNKISVEVLNRIENAPIVYVASITGFEIAMKHRSGKLELPLPPREWMQQVIDHHQLDVIDLDLEIVVRATQLPPIHRDPCDRFIIATAMIFSLPVVTADGRFADYGVQVLI
jgi:PIN domain nuclease of toxin-antitoxin system